jgi:hypothetical protein
LYYKVTVLLLTYVLSYLGYINDMSTGDITKILQYTFQMSVCNNYIKNIWRLLAHKFVNENFALLQIFQNFKAPHSADR